MKISRLKFFLLAIISSTAISLTALTGYRSLATSHSRYTSSPVYKYTYGNLSEDEMPIMAYAGPCDSKIPGTSSAHFVPVNANTLEQYQAIKEAGINTIIPLSDNTTNDGGYELFEALHNAEKAGINYFVHDPNFDLRVSDKESLLSELAKYATYSSFAGVFQADEPSMKDFPRYETVGSLMRQYAPNKCYYVNLYPQFAYYGALTGNTSDPSIAEDHAKNWLEYINKFYNTYQPLYLSYDNYAFTNAAPNIDHDWFGNLNLANTWCKEKGIPFFAFNLATAHLNYRQPTSGEFYWQVNTNLVYGAKGIQYFTYQTPNTFTQDDPNASFIDKYGVKTSTYTLGQNIHNQIKRMDHVLMNCSHQQIIQVNNIPTDANASKSPGYSWTSQDYGVTTNQSWRELNSVNSNDDLLIGCFDYHGGTALLVANDSFSKSASYTLNFSTHIEANVYSLYENSTASGTAISGTLEPGASTLIEITNYED